VLHVFLKFDDTFSMPTMSAKSCSLVNLAVDCRQKPAVGFGVRAAVGLHRQQDRSALRVALRWVPIDACI
jgi:hypothetical protein